MKRCEHPECNRTASHMVIFEATLGPGIHRRLPWRWMCPEHGEKVFCYRLFIHGEPQQVASTSRWTDNLNLFKQFYADLRRRCVAEEPGLWEAAEESGEAISLMCDISKWSEAEVERARVESAAFERRTIPVEHMTLEDAAREIASRS